uniref:hydrogenase maturation nickel metallochaperone HypA/HybF n=1 Tax=uncultured Mitsuokella sp. TaxID=453120 RepID=UPI00262E195B
GAKLAIEHVPLRGRCTKCGREFLISHYDFWCPACGDGVLETISGREMQVKYLEVD